MNQYIIKLDLGYQESWWIVQANSISHAKKTLIEFEYRRIKVKYEERDIVSVKRLSNLVQSVTSIYRGD